MPKFLETDLQKEAAKKGLKGRAAARYVYGGMNNLGAMRGNRSTARGRQMDKLHQEDTRTARREGITVAEADRQRHQRNIRGGSRGTNAQSRQK